MEKVSVVIPTGSRWQGECVRSVNRQSHPEVELVMFPRGDLTLGQAFNKGVRMSTGELLFFLEDDCSLDPIALSTCVRKMNGVDNVTCYCTLLNEDGFVVGQLKAVPLGMWKKVSIEWLGGFDPESEDVETDLMRRAAKAKMRQKILRAYYYRRRLHPGGVDQAFVSMVIKNYRGGRILAYRRKKDES